MIVRIDDLSGFDQVKLDFSDGVLADVKKLENRKDLEVYKIHASLNFIKENNINIKVGSTFN